MRPSAPHVAYRAEQARSEPHLGDSRASSANPSHDELQRQYAFYDRFNSPPARPRLRIVYALAIFAIGAVVGLAGAWWLKEPAFAGFENDVRNPVSDASAPGIHDARTAAVRGIDPHELPYDGLPPDAREQAAGVSRPQIDPGELPYGGLSSARSGAQAEIASDEKRDGKSRQVAADESGPRTTRSAPAAGKVATAKAPRKHRSAHRIAKDREIERIKQQAAEELKKKTESRQSIAQAESFTQRSVRHHEAPAVADRSSRTRAMLASCEHAGNFFLREKCKWQLCGGMWGKNGCPSYQTQASSY